MRMLRPAEVADRLGISTQTLYRLRRDDPEFPSARQISRQLIGFLEEEVDDWLAARPIIDSEIGAGEAA